MENFIFSRFSSFKSTDAYVRTSRIKNLIHSYTCYTGAHNLHNFQFTILEYCI